MPISRVVDIENDLYTISNIICQMVYSFTNTKPSESEATMIKDAVRWAYESKKQEASVDDVYKYLISRAESSDGRRQSDQHLNNMAAILAHNLKDFISTGAYGKWFAGKSFLDMGNKQLVIEVEAAKDIIEQCSQKKKRINN